MRLNLILSLGLISSFASAQVLKVDVKKDMPVKVTNLYQSAAEKKKLKLSSLSQLKDYEINLKWSECSGTAAKIFPTQKEVRGWVALAWLHCLDQELKKKPNTNIASALNAIEQHDDLLKEGPWSSDLASSWISLRLVYLEDQVQKKNQAVAAFLDKLLSDELSLSKDQKSQVYKMLGDLALLRVNYSEAQFLYEEAQDQKDSRYLQEKLDFLAKAKGVVTATKVATETAPETGEEVRIEERLRLSLKQNELIAAIEDSVLILNQYPGSRSARRLKDKPLEIYNQISDTNAKSKALNQMQEADGGRLLDWAQNLHRRADYVGALSLSQKAFEKMIGSPQSTSALWIAGRSAHFLGQYDRALEHYNKLIKFHSGSDEGAEALFRSSLIHYRKKDYLSASALLERLLAQNKDRYDLNARYWLVRSLQESNSERAKKEAADIMTRYPFSYYGLRLRAESAELKLTWPENKEKMPTLQTEFYLVGAQKKSWKRFKTLSAAGWITEAQSELTNLPFLKDPTLKVSLAEKFADYGQFMAAIRMINDAMEADTRLRREQFVKIGYPQIFNALYQAEAERYGLSAVVLKSLTRQESGFNLRAVSTSNALGLMQMIPPTAEEVARKLGLKIELPDDMFRPEVNIPMGSFYISQMLDQFQGSIPFALAAYNAGPTRVKIWSESRPEILAVMASPSSAPLDEVWFDELPWTETSFYVKAILRNILLYRLVDEGSFTLKPVLWQDLHNKKAK